MKYYTANVEYFWAGLIDKIDEREKSMKSLWTAHTFLTDDRFFV